MLFVLQKTKLMFAILCVNMGGIEITQSIFLAKIL